VVKQGDSPPVTIDSSGGFIEGDAHHEDKAAPSTPDVEVRLAETTSAPAGRPATARPSPARAPRRSRTSASSADPVEAPHSSAGPQVSPLSVPVRGLATGRYDPPVQVQKQLAHSTFAAESPSPTDEFNAPSGPVTAPDGPTGAFITVASRLLSAALTPFSAPGPATPAQTPVLWAVLAWVRREFGRTGQTATPPSHGPTSGLDGDAARPHIALTGRSVPIGNDVAGVAIAGDRLYVADAATGSVSAIGLESRQPSGAPIVVGDAPTFVTAHGDRLYVANGAEDTVSVVEVRSGSAQYNEIARIPVGAAPLDLAIGSDLLYVANSLDGTLSVIGITSLRPAGEPIAINGGVWAVAFANDKVYVTNATDSAVSIVDASRSAAQHTVIGEIDLGDDPATGLAATPDGSRLFVTVSRLGSSFVAVIDTETDTVAEDVIATGAAATDVVFSPDGRFAYIAHDGCIAVIDTATLRVLDEYDHSSDVDFMAIDPAGRHLYVSSVTADTMAVLSTQTEI
jgi:YVTN family beta-propeller protein